MPSFIDLYLPRIQQNVEDIRQALLGVFSDSDAFDILQKMLYSPDHWFTLPDQYEPGNSLAGCDGSSISFNMRNGSRLAVTRAFTRGTEKEHRTLDMGMVQGKDSASFLTHIMQLLELQSMRQFAQEHDPEVLFMDGSPITFLTQNLIDLRVYLFKELESLSFASLIDMPPSAITVLLASETIKLLELVQKKNILFIGVSKDSNVSQLQAVLLLEEIGQTMNQLSIPSDQKLALMKSFQAEVLHPHTILGLFESTAKKNKQDPYTDWNELMTLVQLFLFPLNDLEAIDICVPEAGFSCPLELRANKRWNRMKNLFYSNPNSFIGENYSFSLALQRGKDPDAFIKAAKSILKDIDVYPSIISTNVRVKTQSYPMRVDVLGDRGAFWDGIQYTLLAKAPPTLLTAIGIVQDQYVDEKIHNTILWEVDQRVRLTRKDATNIYLSALEHEVGLSRAEFLARREIRHM